MPRTPAQPGVDRRRQILEAALDAFAEHGFEGATTTQIAARAGATQGLIYFYFPKGKEELFAAAFAHQADVSLGTLDLAPLLASDLPPEEALRHAIARVIEALGSARCLSMTRVLWRTMANADNGGDPRNEARRCGLAHVRRLIGQLTDYLVAQASRGTLRVSDPILTARLIVGGMLMLRIAEAEEVSAARREELASHIAAIYTHGLLPDVASISDAHLATARQ
jgi:AcrR family transcriptional regulator